MRERARDPEPEEACSEGDEMRAFRDAVRDILAAEGRFEVLLDGAEPRWPGLAACAPAHA